MKKVNKSAELLETVLERGVDTIYPNRAFLKKKLEDGEKLTIYLGIDPTGPDLHLGHSIPLRKLAQLQKLGHKIILLIGDFTAMSGDPDKTEARKRLTRKDILANCKTYKKQASKILSFTGRNAAEYRFNSTWLGKLTFSDVIDLASKVTVQRMLERDLFEKRIKNGKPLYIHEFMYPLMQGYDSVAMNVDGEVGATDQIFNMLTGRDLLKTYKHKDKFVIALKLLEDPTGRKMGKTEGNMVVLNESPNEMFGKIMSWPDGMIVLAMEMLTDIPMSEVKRSEKDMKSGKLNPRDAKAALAREIIAMYHSEKDAVAAEKAFVDTFKKKNVPDDIPIHNFVNLKGPFPDKLFEAGLCSSKSEARRLWQQGGIKKNGVKIPFDGKNMEVELRSGDVLQVGKRKFLKIK